MSNSNTLPSFYSMDHATLKNWLIERNLCARGADSLFYWHHRLKRTDLCNEDLAKKTIARMQDELSFSLPSISRVQESRDDTVKFLFRMEDGFEVETVLIPFPNKYSVCLSSQVGCAMNCSFCYTGTQGLKRHLAVHEIIGQYIGVWNWHKLNRPHDRPILSAVFMGQGEPLHNFEAVRDACRILIDPRGISLAALRVTVSTAGYLPGLKRWASEMPPVNIALSLHSSIEEKRRELIPLSLKYPLAEIMPVIGVFPPRRKQYVTYEYLLAKNFNDGTEDVMALREFITNWPGVVNVIPFNPYPGSRWQRPDEETIGFFMQALEKNGIAATLRATKGDDILAACGQLKSTSGQITLRANLALN